MATLLEYSLMSAAAYDDRRENDLDRVTPTEQYLEAELDWTLEGPRGAAGSTRSDPSGMDADIWLKNDSEVVIAFRGTEAGRVTANDDFRRLEAILDVGTADDWSSSPSAISASVVAEQYGLLPATILDIEINAQAIAAIELVREVKEELLPGQTLTLTGHSLGGALAIFAGYYHDLNVTVIDPAPGNNLGILNDMIARWGIDPPDASPVPEDFQDIRSYLNSEKVTLHAVNGSVTDLVTTTPFLEQNINLLNEGGASTGFLHSTGLHALLSINDGNDFDAIEFSSPRLLFNMESSRGNAGDVFGLYGSTDQGVEGAVGDYSANETLGIISINESVYREFFSTILTVTNKSGFVISGDSVTVSDTTSSYQPGVFEIFYREDGVSQRNESLQISDLFIRAGLTWVRERAREAADQERPWEDIPNGDSFWYESGGTLGFNFEDLAPAETATELRDAYGRVQFKELMASQIVEQYADRGPILNQRISEPLIRNEIDLTGVLAQADANNGVTFDIADFAETSDLSYHNLVVFGGAGNDVFLSDLAGIGNAGQGNHDYFFGGDGEDSVNYAGLAFGADDAGVTLEYRPNGTAQNLELDWWGAYTGENFDTAPSTENLFAIETATLSSGIDMLILNSIPVLPQDAPFVVDGAGSSQDTLDLSNLIAEGDITISLVPTGDQGDFGSITDGVATIEFENFENVVGSNGNDIIQGDSSANQLFGGVGHDFIVDSSFGSNASDIDILEGNTGADRLISYYGADELIGGAGADRLYSVYGPTVMRGGAGNDIYSLEFKNTNPNNAANFASIHLERGFGNDAILMADGVYDPNLSPSGPVNYGISAIVFEGIDSSEVSLAWDYEEIQVDPQFGGTVQVGAAEVRVDSTGDSIYIPRLWGAFEINPLTGLVENPFWQSGLPDLVFDDVIFDWTDLALSRQIFDGTPWPIENGLFTILATPLQQDRNTALENHNAERSVPDDGDDDTDGDIDTEEDVADGAGDGSTYDGENTQTVSYGSVDGPINANLGDGSVQVMGAGSDTLVNIRSIVGSGYDDSIDGSGEADFIDGAGGNDTLRGFGGSDMIASGAGADIVDGGADTDTITFASATSAIGIDLGAGTGSQGDAAGDTYTDIENIVGSVFDDFIIGDNLANEITGDTGNDTIDGGDSDDIINGGAGDDFIYGGKGRDTLLGGDGNDTIHTGSNYDTVDAGAGDDIVYGENGRDTVDLGDGNDVFFDNGQWGFSGKDTVFGGNGNDTFHGGGAGDALDGGAGIDTLDFSTAPGGVHVNLAEGKGYQGFSVADTYSGIENVVGSSSDDVLIGDGAANRLTGSGGADVITGGAGADVFAFGLGDGGDTISDFENDLDLLDFSATALTFSDLTIANDGAGGAIIDYGAGDQIILTNAAGLIDETDFLFAMA